MGLLKFLPTRAQSEAKKQLLEGAQLVSDLDALVDKPRLKFRFLGKDHLIKTFTNEDFFRYANAAATVSEIAQKHGDNQKLVLSAAYEVVRLACDSISMEDLKKMQPIQMAALLNLIAEAVMGKAYVSSEKKNVENP